MTHDSWIQLAGMAVMLVVQGGLQLLYTSRKLAELCESVRNIKQRCDERRGDHSHHYEILGKHDLKLENHEIRIVQLEKTPAK